MDMDNDTAGLAQAQNGDISNMETASNDANINNTDQTHTNSGVEKIHSKDSKDVTGVNAVNSDSIASKMENHNAMTNGVRDKDISESDQLSERVPKIFVCSEHCKTDPDVEDDHDTSVPSECVKNSASEMPNNGTTENYNSSMDNEPDGKKESADDKNSSENSQRQTVEDVSNENGKNEAASSSDSNPKSMEDQPSILQTNDSTNKGDDAIISEKENEVQPSHTDASTLSDEQQQTTISHTKDPSSTSSSSSASSSSSSQHSSSSKFSFFRSIQNILIATKWSKLRVHGPSKSHKHQNDGDEHDEDQEKHHLQKPEKRQRKISSKSQPGELLREQSHEDKELSSQDQSEISDNSRHSKDKGSSSAKHHFSLFKRHNNSSDSQQRPMSPPTHPPAELTERQKALLRSSWAEIGDSVGQVGVIAFIGLFETHPDVIDHFNQFRGMSLESVFSSISLKEHALRVMTTVEKFLNRIDRPDKLQKILEDLGKRHVGYRFKCEYIRIVGMQFICAMKPHVNSWTPETEQAWTVLIDTMAFHMERGAIMEMQNTSNV